MSARKKLNAAHSLGCAIVAAMAGAITNSWAVFFVSLVALLVADIIAGNIRPPGK